MIDGRCRFVSPVLISSLTCPRGSFGHGVPPQISKTQYDVPLPTVDVLTPPNLRTTERVRAAQCHIYLCRLTEILGELLPLVYGLQPKLPRESSKKLRQIRTDLDMWEDSLPDWLRAPIIHGDKIYAASSLQLAFLAVKMLVSRVELNVSFLIFLSFMLVAHHITGGQQRRDRQCRGSPLFPDRMPAIRRRDRAIHLVSAKREFQRVLAAMYVMALSPPPL